MKHVDTIEEARALNCPRVGDIWSELFSCRIYVCNIDEGVVRALKVTGGGQEALLFESIGNFQDYLMYSTAPVSGLGGWTWCNFTKNEPEAEEWIRDWVERSQEDGYTLKQGFNC